MLSRCVKGIVLSSPTAPDVPPALCTTLALPALSAMPVAAPTRPDAAEEAGEPPTAILCEHSVRAA